MPHSIDNQPTDAPRTEASKANFDNIYDQPDPRAYFRTLTPLDYQIPQTALPVIEQVRAAAGTDRTVLDVCCSYGINGALLRYDVDLAELSEHYTDGETDLEDIGVADEKFFTARRREPQPNVLGLDAAPNAIAYARESGLVADGWAENLEENDASPEFAAGAADVGMIICTGGVGYVGAPTFRRIAESVADPQDLWLTVFVLRTFPYDAIAATLDGYDLVTEQVPDRTFVQRRFENADEQEAAIADVVSRGLDPAGKEADGWFHADCYITRPRDVAANRPLAALLA